MLPPLLAELSAAGVKEDDLRIVIAWNHRPMSAAEILAKTGPDIVRRYQGSIPLAGMKASWFTWEPPPTAYRLG